MTRFACISDLHGHLCDLSHLDFDVLLIGGDICPATNHTPVFQAHWLDTKFRRWLHSIGRPVVGIAGNHDLIFERSPHLVPANLPWIYLQDSGAAIEGIRIHGSPWQPYFGGWAFNLHQDDFTDELAEKWAMIPDDTDVLLLHGPPRGHGDYSLYGHVHTGSPSLTTRVMEIQPSLCVWGHIHSDYGRHDIGRTIGLNVAHVDEEYRPVNAPVVVGIDGETREARVIE